MTQNSGNLKGIGRQKSTQNYEQICKKLVSVFASIEDTVLIYPVQDRHLLIIAFGQEVS